MAIAEVWVPPSRLGDVGISISNLYVVRALDGRASEARDSCFLYFEGITHFLTLRIKIKSGK